MLIFGVILTLTGFIVSPVGQIDDSVLWVLGQCLIYSGSIFGIGIYTKQRLDDMEMRLRHREHKNDDDEELKEEDEL